MHRLWVQFGFALRNLSVVIFWSLEEYNISLYRYCAGAFMMEKCSISILTKTQFWFPRYPSCPKYCGSVRWWGYGSVSSIHIDILSIQSDKWLQRAVWFSRNPCKKAPIPRYDIPSESRLLHAERCFTIFPYSNVH